jgi:transcriptional regulator with XRE-family HTH domain
MIHADECSAFYEEKLRNLIRRNTRSQKDIALDAGITEVTLSNFMNSHSGLTFKNLVSAIEAAGGDLEEFFCISNEELEKIINKRIEMAESGINN